MPSLSVLRVFLRELVTSERAFRVPEPDLVMDDPEKVAAYTQAGREDGVMASGYLYHCAQICEVICPGDTVIDLGCGPATQLGMVARLNPKTQFIGVDLSDEMLDRAKNYVDEQNLKNVSFRQCDITNLDFLEGASVDAVFSTVTLHHLPSVKELYTTFSEVSRVLKQRGGLYLLDFGHLKSEKSINYFAYQYADRQKELFTLDYLYSLRAAYQLDDFKQATEKYLRGRAKTYSTFVSPFMVAVKSPARRRLDSELANQLKRMRQELPDFHKTDLRDLIMVFRLGGLRAQYLMTAEPKQ